MGKWRPRAEQPPVAPLPLPREARGGVEAEGFLRGPIPLDWLRRAAGLPKSALVVGLALWHGGGMAWDEDRGRPIKGGNCFVRVETKLLARLGVGRRTGYRALQTLEAAGLVLVKRRPGGCPWAEIREYHPVVVHLEGGPDEKRGAQRDAPTAAV